MLDQVVVTLDGALYRRYDLQYEFRIQNKHASAYLTGLQECAFHDRQTKCLKPVTFSWDQKKLNPLLVKAGVVTNDSNVGSAPSAFADLTGDGILDFVNLWGIKQGLSGAQRRLGAHVNPSNGNFLIIDYDADGVSDVLYVPDSQKSSTWQLDTYQNGRFETKNTGLLVNASEDSYTRSDYMAADVNGDGIQDIVHIDHHGGVYVYENSPGFGPLSRPKPFNYKFVRLSKGEVGTGKYLHFVALGDVNGDGKADFAYRDATRSGKRQSKAWLLFSNQTGYTAELLMGAYSSDYYPDESLSTYITAAGDVNGDGLGDLYRKKDSSFGKSRLEYGLYHGDRQIVWYDTGLEVDKAAKIDSKDFDGDGRADLVVLEKEKLRVYLVRNKMENEQLVIDQMQFYLVHDENVSGIAAIAKVEIADGDNDGFPELYRVNQGLHGKSANIERYNLTQSGHNRLTQIVSSTGIKTDIGYANYQDASVFVGKTNSQPGYPLVKQRAGYFVKSITKDTPDSSAQVTLSYSYKNGLIARNGRGFLGFEEITTSNHLAASISRKTYNQAFPYIGMVTSQSSTVGGRLVSSITTEPVQKATAQGGIFRYLNNVTEQRWDLQGIELPTTRQAYRFDIWGNAEQHLAFVKSSGDTQEDNQNTRKYFNNDTDRRFGRPHKTEVKIYRNIGGHGRYRGYTNDFLYYPNGAVQQKITQKAARTRIGSQHYSLGLTTDYVYDAFGNVTLESQTGLANADGTSQTRDNKAEFTSNGRLLKWTQNDLGHRETYSYNGQHPDAAKGVIYSAQVTDPNGAISHSEFNGFGEPVSSAGTDGVVTTFSRGVCSHRNCETIPAYSWAQSVTPGQPNSKAYFDRFGNQLGTAQGHQDGSLVVNHQELNWRGLVVNAYRPGKGSSNRSNYTKTQYDLLGRPTKRIEHNIDGAPTASYVYRGLTTDITETHGAVHKTHSKTLDKHGNTVLTVDSYGLATEINYWLNDQVSTIIQDGNASTKIEYRYDGRDNKTLARSPGKGREQYVYNAFGELVNSNSGRNQRTLFLYDSLGRPRERRDSDGISCWSYDQGANGKGQLSNEYVIHNGLSCAGVAAADFARTYSYNNKGQLTNTEYNVKGQGTYQVSQNYQPSTGLLAQLTLPSTTLNTGSVKVGYDYSNGYLSQIKDAVSGEAYQTILDRDVWGNVTLEDLGTSVNHSRSYRKDTGQLKHLGYANGLTNLFTSNYTYDQSGNMRSREFEFGAGPDRSFYRQQNSYDKLNRLTCYEDTATGASLGYFAYDKFGNISANPANAPGVSAGCAGAPTGNQASLNDASLVYSASYPYRLDSVDGKALRYGGSGNVREYRNSKLTYSAADKVLTIDSWNAGKKDSINYSYGPNGDRYRKAVSRYVDGQLENSSTFYISSIYERHSREAGAGKSALTEEKYYIGDVIITKRSNQTSSIFYQLKDDQGSTLMVTDDSGKEVNRYYYTPFGEQRDMSLSPLPSSMLQPSRYGYTGHEHMEGLDIINMGGRIYSHSLRRFLQADPLVAHPLFSQSYNPYQYVYNNPLVNVDPSGYATETMTITGTRPDDSDDKDGLTDSRSNLDSTSGILAVAVQAYDNMPPSASGIAQKWLYENVINPIPDEAQLDAIWVAYQTAGWRDVVLEVGIATVGVVGKKVKAGKKVYDAAKRKTDRLKKHILNGELDAARREAAGEVVARKDDGTPWDHVKELRDAQRGLLKRISKINKELKSNKVDSATSSDLERELGEASRLLDKTEEYLPRK